MSALTDGHPDALLAEFSVGALPPAEQRAIERHLAGCARCRHRLNSLETTALLLRNLPAPEPPRSFLLPPSTPLRRPAPLLLVPLSFLSAAAVLFVALGLSLALNGPGVQTSAARSTAANHAAQAPRSTAVRAYAAATGVAAIHSAAAAARQAPAAAAPAAPPAGATTRTEQTTKESTPSAAGQPARHPPASAPRRYQVLLAIGGAACLLVAALAFLRRRAPPGLA